VQLVTGSSQFDAECRAALDYIVDLHAKQRKDVWSRHDAERAKIQRSLARHALKYGCLPTVERAQSERPKRPVGAVATVEEVEVQARREASTLWLLSERCSLLTAFRQQVRRIQTEWGDYLVKLQNEYIADFRATSGGDPPADDLLDFSSLSSSGERNWLAQAKQESLIHTAPVIAAPSRAVAVHSASPTVQALRNKFRLSVQAVQRQQEDAIRWVVRQSRKMLAQADAQERERQSVFRYEDAVSQEWATIFCALDAVLAAASPPRGAFSPSMALTDGGGSLVRPLRPALAADGQDVVEAALLNSDLEHIRPMRSLRSSPFSRSSPSDAADLPAQGRLSPSSSRRPSPGGADEVSTHSSRYTSSDSNPSEALSTPGSGTMSVATAGRKSPSPPPDSLTLHRERAGTVDGSPPSRRHYRPTPHNSMSLSGRVAMSGSGTPTSRSGSSSPTTDTSRKSACRVGSAGSSAQLRRSAQYGLTQANGRVPSSLPSRA
jgi:hypothetical protein